MQYNQINESKIKKVGFDYIALGHIHKQMIKENIVYPGSTISFGFDELGEHGMLDVDLSKKTLNINFIKLDDKEFVEEEMDISTINSEEELIEKILEIKIDENKLYKIKLIGNKNIEINKNKILKIINKKNILKIKDCTQINFDIEKIIQENNLKSYFIKELNKLKQENNYTDEEINQAMEIGLNMLKN